MVGGDLAQIKGRVGGSKIDQLGTGRREAGGTAGGGREAERRARPSQDMPGMDGRALRALATTPDGRHLWRAAGQPFWVFCGAWRGHAFLVTLLPRRPSKTLLTPSHDASLRERAHGAYRGLILGSIILTFSRRRTSLTNRQPAAIYSQACMQAAIPPLSIFSFFLS